MGTLSRDQILGADDRKTDEVEVPEWGGSVRIRSMSGAELQEYVRAVAETKDEVDNVDDVLLLVHFSIVDDSGNRLFPAKDDVKLLAEKNIHVLNKIAQACMGVNGLDQKEVVADLKGTASE